MTDNTKFLIVEDSPTIRQLISFSLQRFKNALRMPVMDGLKLVSLVRQTAGLKDIPIIITTEGAEEERERGLALGANADIAKPVQSSHLIRAISELLAVSTSS